MRIISGKLKGSSLYTPKNKNTRPLKDLVRESIFNLLLHSKKIHFEFEKSNVLDIYAGTGSFGLECISRQSNNVVFVEKYKDAIEILKKNIDKLNVRKKTKIFNYDIFELIENKDKINLKFNLIFCDPPYKDKNIQKLITLIYNRDLLKKNGIIILHRNKSTIEKLPDNFELIDERQYGISKIIFGRLLG